MMVEIEAISRELASRGRVEVPLGYARGVRMAARVVRAALKKGRTTLVLAPEGALAQVAGALGVRASLAPRGVKPAPEKGRVWVAAPTAPLGAGWDLVVYLQVPPPDEPKGRWELIILRR